ncbi:MAG: universal stress protein [Elusimicrobia bacterium]|nr:universal stress protein [Elusimicrobiota bacterium]
MTRHVPARRILVPIDFSPLSLNALRAAMALGDRFGSLLQLLFVLEPEQPTAMGMAGLGIAAFPMIDSAPTLKAARERLKKESSGYAGPVTLRAVVGSAVATIQRAALSGRADMIVMGTHGRQGLKRVLFGSTAESVVRGSAVPVLTVHGGKRPLQLRRLLCPFNMTPHAERTLAYANALAQELGAALTVLYVRGEHDWEEDQRLELRARLRQTLGSRGSHLDLRIVPGRSPEEAIVREAGRGYDAVVLCEHPLAWSPSQLMGSTAEKTVRDCDVPVLSVPVRAGVVPRWAAARRPAGKGGVLI